jgi:polyisoprenyl-phosphate glycosyltransferase
MNRGGFVKSISVVTPCYNEEGNVSALCRAVKEVFDDLPEYSYEHIFIDNASHDGTVEILKQIAKTDKHVKIIVNARNFGHLRSPYHALFQASGDAMILMAADFQCPPSLVKDFVRKWEEGYKIVAGVKKKSEENAVFHLFRSMYYRLLGRLSETELVPNFTGYGLYDRQVVEILRSLADPYPYFRGLLAEVGFEIAQVEYVQPARQRGVTGNNFYALYDTAMLGFTSHSKVPLRLAAMLGFLSSGLCFLAGLFYFAYKLIYWHSFSVGIGPMVLGLFFIGSVQLFFLGVVGEYVGSIHTRVLNRPLVIEKERINFD